MLPPGYMERFEKILKQKFVNNEIHLAFHWETIPEARMLIKQLAQMKRELALIKTEANNQIKMIKGQYSVSKSNVTEGFWASLGGRSSAARDRATKREKIRIEEQNAIAPYELAKRAVDQTSVELDRIKIEVQQWILRNSDVK